MSLKRKEDFVPIRRLFYQPELNWTSPADVGFYATVDEIIKIRRANPRFKLSTERADVEKELEDSITAQLMTIPGGDAYLLQGAPPPAGSFRLPSPRRRTAGGDAGVAAVDNKPSEASKLKAGVGALIDWIGEGLKPVPAELAEKRAAVCVTCPLNQVPTAAQQLIGAAAVSLHLLMEAKNEMQLKTSQDEKLHRCAGCSCFMRLKVWAPISHVWKHMKPEVAASLDPACWQLMEKRD